MAQRLVRLICESCKESYAPTKKILKELGIEPGVEFYRGKGCKQCKNTGFSGRIGLFEVLPVNENIRKLIEAKSSASQIKKEAVDAGMQTLRQDGMSKVKKGLIVLEEVLSITENE